MKLTCPECQKEFPLTDSAVVPYHASKWAVVCSGTGTRGDTKA